MRPPTGRPQIGVPPGIPKFMKGAVREALEAGCYVERNQKHAYLKTPEGELLTLLSLHPHTNGKTQYQTVKRIQRWLRDRTVR